MVILKHKKEGKKICLRQRLRKQNTQILKLDV